MEQGNDPVNHGRRDADSEIRVMRNFQSVRIILEGLILLGVVWLASSVQEQGKATVQMQTQIANLSVQLSGVPDLSRQVAQDQIILNDHERRIGTLEARASR